MIAGLGRLLGPGRVYHLFDSFQRLPDATEMDGDEAKAYQADTSSPIYYDNCAASIELAKRAMAKAGVSTSHMEDGSTRRSLNLLGSTRAAWRCSGSTATATTRHGPVSRTCIPGCLGAAS
jgi:hypothetical protein